MIMFIMGMNRRLDLQCLFISVVKKMAMAQRWYSQRRILQICFVAFVAVFGLILLILLGWKLKRPWRQYDLALFGILLLIGFVAVRVAPIHHLGGNSSLKSEMEPINSALELTGIALVGISALMGIIRDTNQAVKITSF